MILTYLQFFTTLKFSSLTLRCKPEIGMLIEIIQYFWSKEKNTSIKSTAFDYLRAVSLDIGGVNSCVCSRCWPGNGWINVHTQWMYKWRHNLFRFNLLYEMKNISPFLQTSGEGGFERNCDFSFLDCCLHHHLCLWWQRRWHPGE